MILSDQLIAERSGLAKKDKGELQAIVSALGGKPSGRLRKAELIDQIIELSGAEFADDDNKDEQQTLAVDQAEEGAEDTKDDTDDSDDADSDEAADTDDADDEESSDEPEQEVEEPKQESSNKKDQSSSRQNKNNNKQDDEDGEPNKRRRRSRGRGRSRDRENAGNDPIVAEPFAVEGYLELRDEGYGFLRVDSFLPSREDVYVSVKQVRQYGLRKGDHLTGLSRPANRNEKNPGFHQIDSVNGQSPEDARRRPSFDSMTAVFPDHEVQLQSGEGDEKLAPLLVDLFAPLGRGQRVLLSASPQAGTTTFVRDLAQSIEQNNPNIELLVLLVDQRPEEVSWLRSELSDGEVIASSYDRPPEEHCAVAEITIERAKRLVEFGRDVCLVVDSFSKLVQAYQATSNQNGRGSTAVDGNALYAAKRLFGAARKLEQGGSFTMIATAQTGSDEAEAVVQELASAANSHIVLDKELAQAGVFPAIDVTASHTRREDILLGDEQAVEFSRLRSAIVDQVVSDESMSVGTQKLHQQIESSDSIDDFLAAIMKSLS